MWFSFFLISSFLLAVISALVDEETVTVNATNLGGHDGEIGFIPLMW